MALSPADLLLNAAHLIFICLSFNILPTPDIAIFQGGVIRPLQIIKAGILKSTTLFLTYERRAF
jgi:hypothetical protein